MGRMVWAEMRKLLRSPGVAIVTALGLALMYWVYWQTAANVTRGLWPETLLAPEGALTYSLAVLAVMGSLLSAVFGAIGSGQEFASRTWPVLVTQGAGRRQVWFAKVLAILGVVAGWLLTLLAAGYGGSVWVTGRAAWPHLDAQVVAQASVVYFRLVFWSLVAFAAATVGKGTAAGLAGGIGFPLSEMFFLSALPIRDWLPSWYQIALNAAVFGTEDRGLVSFAGGPYPPAPHALTTLVVMAAAVVALSYAATQRSNLA